MIGVGRGMIGVGMGMIGEGRGRETNERGDSQLHVLMKICKGHG